MRDRIFSAARDAGRDPEAITLAYNIEIRIDERGHPDPSVLAGPSEAVAQRLMAFLRLGFSAFNFIVAGPDAAGQSERLAREVIPEVRRGR
jgi:hypothetical protein